MRLDEDQFTRLIWAIGWCAGVHKIGFEHGKAFGDRILSDLNKTLIEEKDKANEN